MKILLGLKTQYVSKSTVMINFSGQTNLVTTMKYLQSTKNVENYVPQRNPTQAHSQLGEILSE